MRPTRVRRSFNVIATVDAVRERHAELRRPLTVTTIRRVLEQEGIDVLRQPIRAYAYVEGGLGTFAIVMRSGLNPRHERRVLGHEYAHIKLHYQESSEVVYQHRSCHRGDATEIEAQLFVRLLELGPDAGPDHPDVAQYVAALDAASLQRPLPSQLSLPLPEAVPVYVPPSIRYGHGSHNPGAIEDARGRHRRRGPILVAAPHSPYFDWSKNGKPLGWFHPELGWIQVYDLARLDHDGRSRVVTLEAGSKTAEVRVFVVSATDRRRYTFSEGERRTRTREALALQFMKALKARDPRINDAQNPAPSHRR